MASCVAPPVDAPPPRSAPPVTVAPPSVTAPVPVVQPDSATVERGSWSYAQTGAASQARFGAADPAGQLMIECRPAERALTITMPMAAAAVTLRASTTMRSVAASNGRARVAATDPILDALAFSRGRFGIGERWYPAWPELTRVIEDCRA